MKKLLIFITLITGLNSAYADCSSSGMEFFPKQREISLNSMFIIEGYYNSQKTIESFKNRTVFLESEKGEIIKLILQETLKGQMSLTQAIFRLSKELKPNTKYFLKYSNQTENESHEMKQWNSEKEEREFVYWKTSNKKTMELLSSDLKIEYLNTEVVYYGCGPSANATFKIKNKPKTEVWYKAELVNMSTKEKTVFYIREWKETLDVGHEMCSGAFTFEKKGKYKVRFTPMNTDGKSLKATDWKIFESPFMNNLVMGQDSLNKASFIGTWKICTDEGYNYSLDSTFECNWFWKYQFYSDGTYSAQNEQPVNTTGKIAIEGNWNYKNGTLTVDKDSINNNALLPMSMEMKMINSRRLYFKIIKYRHFKNGNKKSFPSYTYFIKKE